MMTILLYALIAVGYFGLALCAWVLMLNQSVSVTNAGLNTGSNKGSILNRSAARLLPIERVLILLFWLAHAALIRIALVTPEGLHFGFAIALSISLWLAVAVLWVESLFYGMASLRLLLLPLAGLCALLPLWFPGGAGVNSNPVVDLATVSTAVTSLDWKLGAHLVVALSAYGLLTIAALHALLMMALERWLHHDEVSFTQAEAVKNGLGARIQNAVLGHLPPLLTLERLLFRLIWIGFILLTLTVLTGIVFSEALFGKPLQFSHKNVFTLISWLIFAALLAGRHWRGWRGRIALRWTLSGFVAMLLAYVGSRFVLEVILHRL